MSYIDKNGKFNHGKWMRERTLKETLNERPINRSKVGGQLGGSELRSNIDLKWTTTMDMEADLKKWLEAVFEVSGGSLVREIGMFLKDIGMQAIKDGTVDGIGKSADRSPEADADRLRQAMQGNQDREI